jgi:hypothetical protein
MIVNRRVFIAKKGCLGEAIKALKTEVARVWPSMHLRYYISNTGTFDTFAAEAEYESLAEYERILAEGAPRFSAEFWQKWNETTEVGGTNEIWDLV